MSQISLKSISGITSITTPAGVDNRFSLYNFDSTERLVLDHSGNLNISGVTTATNFKTGSSNLHSTGLNVGNTFLHSTGVEVAGVNVLGADTPIGTGATIYDSGAAVFTGVVTATQFKGDGSELTGVSGFSTALSNDTSSLLNQIFKTNNTHNVAAGTSVTIQSDIGSGNIAFTRLLQINVATGATVHVAAGTTFLMNVLNVF